MYRMGLMALIASDILGLNRDKFIKIAIVHDIVEAIVGDITPSDGVPKEEKSRREQEAIDHMCKLLGGGSIAKELGELWLEYEGNSSPEAKIVKDFDKVEMILQALEYENDQGKDLEEFFQSTAGIYIFVFYRNMGLLNAVQAICPNAPHGFCYRHLQANLNSKFASSSYLCKRIPSLFMRCAYFRTREYFDMNFKKLKEEGGDR